MQRLARLCQNASDDVRNSAASVAPSVERVDAATDQHKTLVFDKFIVNRLSGDVFALEVTVFDRFCDIRKVHPLKRALKGNKIWITGLRAEHSVARENLSQFEWDESNQIIKYHPILFWTTQQVRDYIKKNNIPYNILHDKGFVSIGCAPCTRAIQPGEDFRAGRWWWEDASKKECGLHVHK